MDRLGKRLSDRVSLLSAEKQTLMARGQRASQFSHSKAVGLDPDGKLKILISCFHTKIIQIGLQKLF
jgi:hypothetical protein